MGAGGTVWIHSGSQASLSTVGLEDSPASARSNMAPPSMIAVTVHRFNYFFGFFNGSATMYNNAGQKSWRGKECLERQIRTFLFNSETKSSSQKR